jgi:accessory gene regulator B
MINNLSVRLTDRLLAKGSITEDERELYIYGFFMLLSQLVYFLLACIVGLLFQCFFESVIFYIAFQFIRRYAGGYHAKTETRCEILSSLSIIGSIGIIRLLDMYDFQIVLLSITLFSAGCIFVLCPLDTPEKPLTKKEFQYFRKISRIILVVIFFVVIISYFFKVNILFAPCCMSLILESILLLAGKIKKVHTERSTRSF